MSYQKTREEISVNIVEITTYRTESSYSDKRHPDKIHWAKRLKEDLSRRDFTSNAIAVKIVDDKTEIMDPYRGSDDISNKNYKSGRRSQ